MSKSKHFTILYTRSAEEDILAKAEYIEKVFHDSRLAYTWYQRLKNEIQKELTFLPKKYQIYDHSPWKKMEIQEFIFRNDIVMYSVNEENDTVTIHAVFTAGKDLSEDVFE